MQKSEHCIFLCLLKHGHSILIQGLDPVHVGGDVATEDAAGIMDRLCGQSADNYTRMSVSFEGILIWLIKAEYLDQ